jgi:hypothetical protein
VGKIEIESTPGLSAIRNLSRNGVVGSEKEFGRPGSFGWNQDQISLDRYAAKSEAAIFERTAA